MDVPGGAVVTGQVAPLLQPAETGQPQEVLIERGGVYYYPCGHCEVTRDLSATMPYPEGEDVRYVQELLIQAGYLDGPPDGQYGPETARAVAGFQRAHGLEPSSELDLVTWETLAAATEGAEFTAAPAGPPGFVSILIDATRLTLTVFSDGEVFRRFTVAAGKASTPTPLGEWTVKNKGVWGGAFGSRWIGLSIPFATYGIHGTNRPGSIGSHASHGCIRMHNRDVEILYRWVRPGTPVKIAGRPTSHFGEVPRVIKAGFSGTDVMLLQQALKDRGLYRYRVDGRFEAGTLRALRDFQWANLMPVTGVADKKTREALGLP